MKSRIDEIISQHVVRDSIKERLSAWRMSLHIWLMVTGREKFIIGFRGIFREFRGSHSPIQ